jgi:hypothetical protein
MGIIKCKNPDCGKPYDDCAPRCPFCQSSGRKVRGLGKADDDGISVFRYDSAPCPECGEEVPGSMIRVSPETAQQSGLRDMFMPDPAKHKCKVKLSRTGS